MTSKHLITPPIELVQQWASDKDYDERDWLYELHIATQAAQWGADQELEACCEVLARELICDGKHVATDLHTVRRPKPPRLKEQALKAIGVPTKFGEARVIEHREHELIHRALEALDD